MKKQIISVLFLIMCISFISGNDLINSINNNPIEKINQLHKQDIAEKFIKYRYIDELETIWNKFSKKFGNNILVCEYITDYGSYSFDIVDCDNNIIYEYEYISLKTKKNKKIEIPEKLNNTVYIDLAGTKDPVLYIFSVIKENDVSFCVYSGSPFKSSDDAEIIADYNELKQYLFVK